MELTNIKRRNTECWKWRIRKKDGNDIYVLIINKWKCPSHPSPYILNVIYLCTSREKIQILYKGQLGRKWGTWLWIWGEASLIKDIENGYYEVRVATTCVQAMAGPPQELEFWVRSTPEILVTQISSRCIIYASFHVYWV